MDLAFGLDPSAEVSTYNYLSEFQTDPTGMAGEFYRVSSHLALAVRSQHHAAVVLTWTCAQHSALAALQYCCPVFSSVAHTMVLLQASTKVETIVTIGTTLMANTSDSYASFAVLMYQAFGRKVCTCLLLASAALTMYHWQVA